jgi:hypothetical protein
MIINKVNIIFKALNTLFFTAITILSFIYMIEQISNNSEINFITVLKMLFIVAVMFAFISFFCYKRKGSEALFINNKIFIIFIGALSISVGLIEVSAIKTEPISDFKAVYDGAKQLLAGDFNLSFSSVEYCYWYRYPYQLGFTFYEFLVMKIFFGNTDYIIFRLLNVLWMSGNVIMVYLICKKVFNEIAARTASLLTVFYIPFIFSISVMTNQHMSAFFILLAVFFIIKKRYLICALSLGLSCVFRPLASLFFIAFIVYIIYKYLEDKNLKLMFKNLIKIVTGYYSVIVLVSLLFIQLGMTTFFIAHSTTPYWKYLVGTNYESNGRVGGEFENEMVQRIYKTKEIDYKEFNSISKDTIIKRVKEDFPFKIIKLMGTKFIDYWTYKNSFIQFSAHAQDNVKSAFYNKYYGVALENLEHIQRFLIYLLTLTGAVYAFYKKKNLKNTILLNISLWGIIVIHLISEIQTRYRYTPMFIIIIFASYGFSILVSKVQKLKY